MQYAPPLPLAFNASQLASVLAAKPAPAKAISQAKPSPDQVIHWRDIDLSVRVLPQLEQATHALICRRLGFLPHESFVLPHEPFLRSLMLSHQQGNMIAADFTDAVEQTVMQMRNELMRGECWDMPMHTPEDLAHYDAQWLPYKDAARTRLVGFLKYEPASEHSLLAELTLRRRMAYDTTPLPAYPNELDLKMIQVVFYRQDLFTFGRETADQLMLCGVFPALPL